MYHVSDLKKFIRCPRLFYQSEEILLPYVPYVRNDETLTLLFAQKLKMGEYFLGQRNDQKEVFLKQYDHYEWFIKARLEYNDLRVKIPILHKVEGGVEVYFTYYGLYPKENDLDYYRLHLEVLLKNHLEVKAIYIIHLNSEYVYREKLDPEELFVVSDCFYNERLHPSHKLMDVLFEEHLDIDTITQEMKTHELKDYHPFKRKVCTGRNVCPYYARCFKDETLLPDDSIMTLVSCKHKNKMYQNGIRYLKDVDVSLIEGNRLQYAQIMASRNGGLYFELHPLKEWMKKLEKKPICFIDFEWDRYLIPPFEGLKPCDVVCFEFAAYVLEKDGTLHDETFIGTKDCRKAFIEKLLETVPKEGPIVAYNAIGAEVLRLKELASQFKEYEKELLALTERFVDLSYPFTNGLVYDVRMRGNFSLKQLLSVVSEYSYQTLDIHDGMQAVDQWRYLDRGDYEEDPKLLFQHLKEYCSMDAYALYLLYIWLLDLVSRSVNDRFIKSKEVNV